MHVKLRFRHTHPVIMSPVRRCMKTPLQFGCCVCLCGARQHHHHHPLQPNHKWPNRQTEPSGTEPHCTSGRQRFRRRDLSASSIPMLLTLDRSWDPHRTEPEDRRNRSAHVFTGPETTAPHPSLSVPLNIHSHDLSVKLDTPVPGETDENLHGRRCHVMNICMSFRWDSDEMSSWICTCRTRFTAAPAVWPAEGLRWVRTPLCVN